MIPSRTIYWSFSSPIGSINRAGMDGSNPVEIIGGLGEPFGITIDFEKSRLYWAEAGYDRIRSSTMEGADIQTVVGWGYGATPYGLTLLQDRLYITTWGWGILYSYSEADRDLSVLYDGNDLGLYLFQAAAIPRQNLPTDRINHCANANCTGVCVLSPTSFSCLG